MSKCNLLNYEDWLIINKDLIELNVKSNSSCNREDVISTYYNDYVSWYKGAHLEEFPILYREYLAQTKPLI